MRWILFSLIAAMTIQTACTTSNPNVDEKSAQPTPPPTPRPEGLPEPDWAKNAVIYQCNVRQFSPQGNFDGVTAQLPRIKELGVDILWLMPIQPIGQLKRKGSLGSPYSIQDYRAVNPEYGTSEDLKEMISKAHSLGIKVILDWVGNHTSWDAVWLQQHPDFYNRYNGQLTTPIGEDGKPIEDWSDVCDLDYGNPALRRAMIETMQFWLKEYDLDGFRCDVAGLIPNDFWQSARPALDSVKTVFMLSEHHDNPDHFKSCFNANYGWKFKEVTRDIANGKKNASAMDSLLQFLDGYYPDGYYQLYFTQNHDENTWHGTEADLFGKSADLFNVLSFTWQGIPMIYNGQEDILTQRLKFFDKDPIKWKKMAKTPFYQTLTALRHENKALWSGKSGGKLVKIPTSDDEKIYAFAREKDGDVVIVILNMSNRSQSATVNPPASLTGAYANVFGENTMQVGAEIRLNLKPWDYLVLSNK